MLKSQPAAQWWQIGALLLLRAARHFGGNADRAAGGAECAVHVCQRGHEHGRAVRLAAGQAQCQADYSTPVLPFTALPVTQLPQFEADTLKQVKLDDAMTQTLDTLEAIDEPRIEDVGRDHGRRRHSVRHHGQSDQGAGHARAARAHRTATADRDGRRPTDAGRGLSSHGGAHTRSW